MILFGEPKPPRRQTPGEHRPRYYRHLKKRGELDQALNGALNDTLRAIADMVSKGLQPHEAREVMLYEWLFPPGEEDLEEAG